VLVWLHGGGFWFGQPTRPRENGRRLSATEDVVVVAPSHRLGLLGYLDTRELFGGDANVGMTDIVLALRWVRDNIAAFGGDPGNVTLFGESGGGMKIATLLAMPGAAGLFHRGICQSGVMPLPGAPGGLDRDQAGEIVAEVLAAVGDKRALLEAPAAELARLPVPALGWQPILDDETLPVPVPEALAAGASATTPLMAGSNAAEMRVLTRGPDRPATLEELAARLGGDGDMARHYVEHGADFASAAEQALTDHVFRHPTTRFAEIRATAGGAPVYVYLLRWHNPARPDVGAGHGVETSLVFGNLDAVPALRDEPSAAAMGAAMRSAWASFARTGVPTAAGEPWPAFTVDGRATLIWDLPPVVVSDPPPLF
jgi:para-nitrobenzyl esterase